MLRKISLLGSTGSIGQSTLDVVEAHPDSLEIVALAAGRNRELFRTQCEIWKPVCVSLERKEDADWLRSQLSYRPEIHFGPQGLLACALHGESDTLVAAIMGYMGLASTEAALRAGKRVCLANKESLVVGGELMLRALREGGGQLLPVDSEHAALHQLLEGRKREHLYEVRITASGGPFREWPLERIQKATIEEALNHPTWKMGAKITIDSATLMNKGLEVIEAARLFDLKAEQIQVTLHPQSQVHAMVGFTDGSYQLQVCANDMKHPIQYALFYPDCKLGPLAPYDWNTARTWTFDVPDLERFPCLRLAYEALKTGGTAPAILNAANEVAVSEFLAGRIGFWDIPLCNEHCLKTIPSEVMESLEQLAELDQRVRACAEKWTTHR